MNHSVVIKQDKPPVPSGLPPVPIAFPPAVENIINDCFEYDLHNRPSMEDILCAFERYTFFRCNNTTYSNLNLSSKIKHLKSPKIYFTHVLDSAHPNFSAQTFVSPLITSLRFSHWFTPWYQLGSFISDMKFCFIAVVQNSFIPSKILHN